MRLDATASGGAPSFSTKFASAEKAKIQRFVLPQFGPYMITGERGNEYRPKIRTEQSGGKRDPMTTRGYAAMAWGTAFSHFHGSNSSILLME